MISMDTADPFYLQPYLYVTLHSEMGCIFSIRVTFHKEDSRDKGGIKDDSPNRKDTMSKTGSITNNGAAQK